MWCESGSWWWEDSPSSWIVDLAGWRLNHRKWERIEGLRGNQVHWWQHRPSGSSHSLDHQGCTDSEVESQKGNPGRGWEDWKVAGEGELSDW